MTRRTTASDPQLKFYQKLILNRFLLTQFGVDDLQMLSKDMKKPSLEEIDSEGVTGFYKQLITQFGGTCTIREETLARYDLNIVSHMRKINEKRDEPIALKYFQYLSLLFIEYYLDEYFNNRQELLDALNSYVFDFNKEYPNDTYEPYTENDLNKIAVWSATGSGKTLIMHVNYHQYIHYSGGKLPDGASYILLTPKEGLSNQHLVDYTTSSISASIYDKSISRWMQKTNEINILENTKLGDKDQETIVSVERFGNRNVVFVDEGHRGSSSGRDGKWQKYRDELCSNGFSFEYSATFGQAITASRDKSLSERYAKCIIFDYSYKFFYGDGYGKDYNIINLPDDNDEMKRNVYLTACLMSYYQQKKLYLTKESEYAPFNIENPLFVFVGASVNAVRTKDGRQVSDVVDILLFFRDFITNISESKGNIKRILSGNTGLLDSRNQDIFRNSFPYLMVIGITPAEMYLDILKTVFNCASAVATLHIENLRGISGEIQLRLGENEPFGVINVGDDRELIKLCEANGFNTSVVPFSESLFYAITKPKSTVNLLIGSKKFTEGWNCWRVSTMGLMNVGRSEGSEIIQLFGRGVRLKGHGMSLKRSSFYKKDFPETVVPKYIGILETLNIFGVRADYMKQFKDFLKAEDVPSEKGQPLTLKMPVIRNKKYKSRGLYSLRVKGGVDFKKDAAKPFLKFESELPVVTLDCYSKVQFESSQNRNIGEVTKNVAVLSSKHLAFLDYDTIYSELQRYKNEKARHNVNITRQDLKKLLHINQWYRILILEDELVVRNFEDYKRFEKIAVALLIKYFDRFYYAKQNKWESKVVGYELIPLDDSNENFLNEEEDEYSISIDENETNKATINWLRRIIAEVETAKNENKLPSFAIPTQGDVEVLSVPEHLYNPLLYLAKGNLEIVISPVVLNENELKFVKALQNYITTNADRFAEKELYLIRNRSRKGIGFFDNAGFYPDFILWLIVDDKQFITFIDPHGMGRESISSSKVKLLDQLKGVQVKLNMPSVVLTSFILSPTKYLELVDRSATIKEWNAKHVLFMDDNDYIGKMFEAIMDNHISKDP
ncbi:MAG: DEAD/DEAH box helicase family protein [Candidatus Cloacimonadia bacterium]